MNELFKDIETGTVYTTNQLYAAFRENVNDCADGFEDFDSWLMAQLIQSGGNLETINLTVKNYNELPEPNQRKRSYNIEFAEDISTRTTDEIKSACFQGFGLWTDRLYIIDKHTVNYSGYID